MQPVTKVQAIVNRKGNLLPFASLHTSVAEDAEQVAVDMALPARKRVTIYTASGTALDAFQLRLV